MRKPPSANDRKHATSAFAAATGAARHRAAHAAQGDDATPSAAGGVRLEDGTFYAIEFTLGGDYPWVSALLGLAGHNSTFPCNLCDVHIDDLPVFLPSAISRRAMDMPWPCPGHGMDKHWTFPGKGIEYSWDGAGGGLEMRGGGRLVMQAYQVLTPLRRTSRFRTAHEKQRLNTNRAARAATTR